MWLNHGVWYLPKQSNLVAHIPGAQSHILSRLEDTGFLGVIHLWYSELTAAYPIALKIPS